MELKTLILISVLFVIIASFGVMAVEPFGATVTEVKSERAPQDNATANNATAGNVTELTVFGYSNTQSWQGYFGNVTGTIQLADADDNVMYNWSEASPQGEIYASTNSTIQWQYIQCFNFTATGTYEDDTSNAGDTSLYGTNLTQLEARFNINASDVDGVDETFNLWGAGTHNNLYINNLQFSEGECRNTRVYSNASTGEDDKFEEILLYEPATKSVVFATILNEDVMGFDDRTHDFEMLVLEDGHGTDTQVTTYYFWVELE